ncbi:MAG: 4-(cytidine 5'-diphospho)-2-C-methyl-D-erythritol kinase [Clostridia bacterium]|nr:4-(cytidine 5'-diphospho)-2-C-methyl-D-erythritol kinase [Clostridia bacterium]
MKHNPITVLSFAKINLTLDITGKLPNGYHTVDMVMQTVSLLDKITVEKLDIQTNNNYIQLSCNKEHIPCDKRNTAYKAVEYFSEYCGIVCQVKIMIEKNIPSQAGLAGGSTDGAGVLVALNRLYDTHLTNEQLAEIGTKIGADVPFCIYGGTMLATGIGTDLQKVEHNFDLQKYYILLCKPNIGVSTPMAYQKSDNRPFAEYVHSTALINAMQQNNETDFLNSLYNDFDSLLELSEVQNIKSIMKENGALQSVMSGSGPTVYGIYNDTVALQNTYNILKQKYTETYSTKTCDSGQILIDEEYSA